VTAIASRLRELDPDRRAALVAAIAGRGEEFGVYPASSEQRRLWLAAQLYPDDPAYNVPYALRLRGRCDAAALGRALAELGRRHEALRTVLVAVLGEPLQVVLADPPWELSTEDCTAVPAGYRDAFLAARAGAEAGEPFELDGGAPVRATLLRFAADDAALLLTLHHVCCDGWSVRILFGELAVLLAGGDPGPVPYQYADYARWQQRWLAGPAGAADRAYWAAQLAGAPAISAPPDRQRPGEAAIRGGMEWFAWPAGTADRLAAFCRAEGATPFQVLLAAYTALLYRRTGQADLVVGSPVAARTQPEAEGVVGFLVNTVALRVRVTPGARLRDLLDQARETTLAAHAHQDLPFEEVVTQLRVPRSAAYHPLFQTVLVVQDGEAERPALPGLEVTRVHSASGTSKFDLTVAVTGLDGAVTGWVEYDTALYRPGTVRRLLADLRTLLDEALSDPDRPIGTVPTSAPAALPAPQRAPAGAAAGTPALEGLIARVWCEVLERERVGADENFFDLGGSSILLLKVRARLQDELGTDVRTVTLFSHPTVRALAEHLGAAAPSEVDSGADDRGDRVAAGRRLLGRRAGPAEGSR
jgi:Condensation domain/Phosphopantetheine attachment site